jgi:hypothetical protein
MTIMRTLLVIPALEARAIGKRVPELLGREKQLTLRESQTYLAASLRCDRQALREILQQRRSEG